VGHVENEKYEADIQNFKRENWKRSVGGGIYINEKIILK
jgi:hypothetical protein